MKNTGISDQDWQTITEILKSVPSVKKAVLFGSRAMGLARSGSDVDIMLYGEGLSLKDLISIKSRLEDTNLPYEFDLVLHTKANEKLLEHVKTYGQDVFARGMGNGWQKGKLSEFIDIIGGGTPRTTMTEYWNGTIPWLSVVDFNNDFRKVYHTEKSITPLGLEKSSTKLLNENDIIISARGTVGAIAQLGKKMAFNQSCYGIRGKSNVDNTFLYYLIKTKIEALQKNSHGSVFSTITRDTFDSIQVSLPPLKEQKRIAAILSSLDDKIEVNNQINKNLEEQAQAIFKSWFVDKINTFAEEDGVPLSSLVTVVDNRGKTPPTAKDKTKFPILDVRALSGDCRIIDYKNCLKFVDEETYNTGFRSGHPNPLDIIISTVGSIAEMKMFMKNKGCVAQNVVALRCNKISPYYLYQYLLHIKNDLISYNIGSVQPSIKVTHIIKHHIFVPDEKALELFDEIAQKITSKIFYNSEENQKLIQLRYTLLPKLMSGEINA